MGVPIEKQIKNLSPGMKIAGAVILALFVLFLFRGPNRPKDVTLTANVTFNEQGMTVTNGDRFDWSNVRLTVNSEYEIRLEQLKAGDGRILNPTDLTNKHNVRFQPLVIKPKDVTLSADTPQGRGYYVGQW